MLTAQSTSDLFPLAFKRLPLATFDRPAGLFARLTWIQTDQPVKFRYTTRTSKLTSQPNGGWREGLLQPVPLSYCKVGLIRQPELSFTTK